MDGSTINRTEYSHKMGERYEPRRPRESDILKGEGAIESESHTRREYQPKKGERYDARKHDSDDIWKVRLSFHHWHGLLE